MLRITEIIPLKKYECQFRTRRSLFDEGGGLRRKGIIFRRSPWSETPTGGKAPEEVILYGLRGQHIRFYVSLLYIMILIFYL